MCSGPTSLPMAKLPQFCFPKEHPRRRPPPSTLCLCPCGCFPRRAPFFGGSETPVDEALAPIQFFPSVQLGKKHTPDFQPQILLFPIAQPAPASAGAGVFLWQIAPTCSGFEDPKNTFQDAAIVAPRTTATAALRQERFDLFPLLVGQECFSHPQFFK